LEIEEANESKKKFQKYRKAFLGEFIEAILAAVIVAVILRIFFVAVYRVPTNSMAPALIPGDFVVGWKTSYGLKLPFLNFRWGERLPKRGDIVSFRIPNESALYVKRVIGLPGDRISIRNGRVSVNGIVITSEPLRSIVSSGELGSSEIGIDLRDLDQLEDVELSQEAQVSEVRDVRSYATHSVMRRHHASEADFLADTIVHPGEVFLMGDFRSESVDSRHWGAIPIAAIESRISWVLLSFRLRNIQLEGPSQPAKEAAIKPSTQIRWHRLLQPVR
jgi:signal peptidase I